MKNATVARTIDISGTLDDSNAVAMGIDAGGMQFVLDTLSNLYSNNELAVVREYSCNARDSHVEAGVTAPIVVLLPSTLNPQFRVQDFGTGLTRESLIKVFAQYGSSTKRDSNKMIGAFGVGSKSAFAVGNQFLVTAVKDGERTVALFSKTSTGPTVNILQHEYNSEERNGVLIDVAIENVEAVREAASQLFQAWPKGSVLVDGKIPESYWDNAEELAKGVYIDASDKNFGLTSSRFKLIMGGVPYVIPVALWNEMNIDLRNFITRSSQHKVTYLMNVNIGSVDITPSREELRITPLTIATLRHNIELIKDNLGSWMTKQIEDAPTIWQAARAYRTLSTKLGHQPAPQSTMWRGQSLVPSIVKIEEPVISLHQMGYGGRYKAEVSPKWEGHITGTFNDILFVTGIKSDTQLQIVKRHARIMLQDNPDTSYSKIIAVEDDSMEIGWFSFGPQSDSGIATLTYDEYRAEALAIRKANLAAKGSNPRSKTQYDTYIPSKDRHYDDGPKMTADELNDKIVNESHTVMWLPQKSALNMNSRIFDKHFTGDMILVQLSGSKKSEPLIKAVPTIELASTFFKAKAQEVLDGMTLADQNLFKTENWVNSSNHKGIKFLITHKAKITNKGALAIVDAYEAAKQPTSAQRNRMVELREVYDMLGVAVPVMEKESLTIELRAKLPMMMIAVSNDWYGEHEMGNRESFTQAVIQYINDTQF